MSGVAFDANRREVGAADFPLDGTAIDTRATGLDSGVDVAAGGGHDLPSDMPVDAPMDNAHSKDGPSDTPADLPLDRPADAPDAPMDQREAGDLLPNDGPHDAPADGPTDGPSDAPADGPSDGATDGSPDAPPGGPPPACQMDKSTWAEALGGEKPPVLGGLATSANGIPWIAGQFTASHDFGSGILEHGGGTKSNAFLAKLDPTTGLASVAFAFDNPGDKDQAVMGVAVASDGAGGGNVGIIGNLPNGGDLCLTGNYPDGTGPTGDVGTAGIDFIQPSNYMSFYAVLDGASNTSPYVQPIKVHMVDVGTGSLLAVASHPTQNAFALCGKTSKAVPKWNDSGATKGVITGDNATFGGGNYDLIVAKIDAVTGAILWGKQYGGVGDQVCEAIALDESGNVVIAGNYNGDLFGLPTLADTTGSTAVLFVARLNGVDGTLSSAKAWGGSSRSDAHGLTVDGTGNVIMGGGLGSAVDFGGGHSVAFAGLIDAFVVKLDSSLNPVWAKSYGDAGYDQAIKSVAAASNGNVFIGGLFTGSLAGVGAGAGLGLTCSSNAAPDGFVAELGGTDGSVICARPYGDPIGAQSITNLSVARAAAGALADAVFTGGKFFGTLPLDNHPTLVSPGVPACTTDDDCPSGDTCQGTCRNYATLSSFIIRLAP